MEKVAITEESGIHQQWYKDAAKQTPDTLPAFIDHVLNDYSHNYGTCVHASAAIAIAAAWAANSKLGLTGFQAGGVMWQFIREWNYSSNKTGLRILDYDNVLYVQYGYKFKGQGIDSKTWAAIQKEAQVKIDEDRAKKEKYDADLITHTAAMAEFRQQFPDYDSRPQHYKRLSGGTGAQWEAERKKEESGFVFAPSEPLYFQPGPEMLKHWESIVEGYLPFGMVLTKE